MGFEQHELTLQDLHELSLSSKKLSQQNNYQSQLISSRSSSLQKKFYSLQKKNRDLILNANSSSKPLNTKLSKLFVNKEWNIDLFQQIKI